MISLLQGFIHSPGPTDLLVNGMSVESGTNSGRAPSVDVRGSTDRRKTRSVALPYRFDLTHDSQVDLIRLESAKRHRHDCRGDSHNALCPCYPSSS